MRKLYIIIPYETSRTNNNQNLYMYFYFPIKDINVKMEKKCSYREEGGEIFCKTIEDILEEVRQYLKLPNFYDYFKFTLYNEDYVIIKNDNQLMEKKNKYKILYVKIKKLSNEQIKKKIKRCQFHRHNRKSCDFILKTVEKPNKFFKTKDTKIPIFTDKLFTTSNKNNKKIWIIKTEDDKNENISQKEKIILYNNDLFKKFSKNNKNVLECNNHPSFLKNTININSMNNINININNNIHPFIHPPIPYIRLMNNGIQRIGNRIELPVNHALPINLANRINRVIRRNLTTMVALPNDDLLALSSKESWILRNNSIKYVIYKDKIINCPNILMIKKALPISDSEFVIEITIIKKKDVLPYHSITSKISRKNNLLYIFFNLNYEEICRRNLNLNETYIISDNDYIYINDLNILALMNKKNKEVINIIEINSLGPIFPNKLNKSFIIQEKENNAIVEYRIINNEVIRGEQLIGDNKIKLLAGLDDDFNTLIIQYKKECLLFLQ